MTTTATATSVNDFTTTHIVTVHDHEIFVRPVVREIGDFSPVKRVLKTLRGRIILAEKYEIKAVLAELRTEADRIVNWIK